MTLEDVKNGGYNIDSIKEVEHIGLYQTIKYAKEKDIVIEDVLAIRINGTWCVFHKVNPTKGFINHPILPF